MIESLLTSRELIRSDCDEMMGKYGVGANQVVWLGGSSHYVPESRALVERFRATNQIPPNSVIFHDKGNAFMDHGESIIPSLFGTLSATYPPLVHQFLRPNDNRFHGAAKAKWRSLAAERGWGKDEAVDQSCPSFDSIYV